MLVLKSGENKAETLLNIYTSLGQNVFAASTPGPTDSERGGAPKTTTTTTTTNSREEMLLR